MRPFIISWVLINRNISTLDDYTQFRTRGARKWHPLAELIHVAFK
jgi:hypothetical protein